MSPAAPRPRKNASSANASRDRRADGLRRVRAGVKLRARNGVIARTPLAERWLRLVEEMIDHEELAEGLRYAKLGQIVTLQPQDGAIAAEVQGRATKPYATRLIVGAYGAPQWDRIIEAMAGEAVYLVKLLADELPEGIETLLETEGLTLLPETAAELTLECDCREGKPCRHAAAIGYLFTEQLSNDPLLIFALRARPPASCPGHPRAGRGGGARGSDDPGDAGGGAAAGRVHRRVLASRPGAGTPAGSAAGPASAACSSPPARPLAACRTVSLRGSAGEHLRLRRRARGEAARPCRTPRRAGR